MSILTQAKPIGEGPGVVIASKMSPKINQSVRHHHHPIRHVRHNCPPSLVCLYDFPASSNAFENVLIDDNSQCLLLEVMEEEGSFHSPPLPHETRNTMLTFCLMEKSAATKCALAKEIS